MNDQLREAATWAHALPMTHDYDQEVRLAGYRLSRQRADWTYTPAQEEQDGKRVMAAFQEHLHQLDLRSKRQSHYFGKPGGKKLVTVELTVSRATQLIGHWGARTFFFFRHDDGRQVRWLQSSGRPIELKVGQRVKLTGRVKEHQAGGQEPITVMSYCTVEIVS